MTHYLYMPMVAMTTVDSYFNRESVLNQAKKVKRKRSHGIDGISAKEALKIAEKEYSSIKTEVLNGTYQPDYILKVNIPKGNGKVRTIGNANTRDRIVQGCIHNYLYDVLDSEMSNNNFGFRNNHNCQMAVLRVIDIIQEGYEWIISIDLMDCFTNLNKHLILWLLHNVNVDNRIINSINNIISNKYINGDIIEPVKGCPQGSNISPDLCNMVLNQLDKVLEERGHPFVRYADDIYVFCRSQKAAQRILKSVKRFLEKKLKLIVNEEKTQLFHCKEKVWSCLGFLIKQDVDIHIYMNPKKEEKLRMNIKGLMHNAMPNEMIQKINSLTCGWICCNYIADMGRATKRMDAYIKRSIRGYERRHDVKVDTTKLKSCHGYYKRMLQQVQSKEKESESVGNTNQKQSNNQPRNVDEHDTEVSLSVRAPPKSDSHK